MKFQLSPISANIRFPFQYFELARKENAYLSLFDRRVIWVKGNDKPIVQDLDAPIAVNGKITRIYLHGTRVCGLDSSGWLTRSYRIETNFKSTQDGDFTQLEGDTHEQN